MIVALALALAAAAAVARPVVFLLRCSWHARRWNRQPVVSDASSSTTLPD